MTPKDFIAGIIKARGVTHVQGGNRLTLLRDKDGDGVYEAKVEKPAKGWTAFFIELTYPAPGGDPPVPLKLTTQVSVVPDVLPFKFPLEGKKP